MDKKTRFWTGFLLITFVFALPLSVAIVVQAVWVLALLLAGFFVCVYMLYRLTIKNIKPKYPLLSPEGHPDIYTGRMPRPIYEDMEQYPWFFKKRREKIKHRMKEAKKKH